MGIAGVTTPSIINRTFEAPTTKFNQSTINMRFLSVFLLVALVAGSQAFMLKDTLEEADKLASDNKDIAEESVDLEEDMDDEDEDELEDDDDDEDEDELEDDDEDEDEDELEDDDEDEEDELDEEEDEDEDEDEDEE